MALDMGRTVVILPAEIIEPKQDNSIESGEQAINESAGQQVEGNDLPVEGGEPAPADTPDEAPEDSILLTGGFFRLRELYKPGTGKLKEDPVRTLRSNRK